MTPYLAALERPELDELTRTIEHAHDVAHIALRCAPLDSERLAAACGVAQDCDGVLHDCYDESLLRLAAEFDRACDGR